jgi:hypothetical protein
LILITQLPFAQLLGAAILKRAGLIVGSLTQFSSFNKDNFVAERESLGQFCEIKRENSVGG